MNHKTHRIVRNQHDIADWKRHDNNAAIARSVSHIGSVGTLQHEPD
jgi:hypothetical protein